MSITKSILWIVGVVVSAGSLVVALTQLSKYFKEKSKRLRDWFNEPTRLELAELRKQFTDKDYRDCQTDILDFLKDIENGDKKSEVQIEHMCKLYKHYTSNLNGNTYVHTEWERVFPMLKCKGEK